MITFTSQYYIIGLFYQQKQAINLATAIQLMILKRDRRVYRHRLPNLSQPGMKFDGMSNDNPSFFQKISNTFKLLQQPYIKNQRKQYTQSQIAFRNNSQKKKLSFRRTQNLAKPKQRSMSTTEQLKQAKNLVKHQRYSHSQMSNKHKNTKKQVQIIASDLATFSISKILAYRDQLANAKPTPMIFESQEDQVQFTIRKSSQINQDLLSDKNDFQKWANKIVGVHGKPYDLYDKKLMQRVKDYRRKENNLNFKSMWK